MLGMAFGADSGEAATSTCAVCAQLVGWNGDAWEHEVTGVWANAPVRHQASPTPQARAAGSGRRGAHTAIGDERWRSVRARAGAAGG